MFKNLSLKLRIMSLLVPVVGGFLVTSTLLCLWYWRSAQNLEGLGHSEDYMNGVSAFIDELQVERAKSVLWLNQKIPRQELDAQRSKVDEKYKVLPSLVKELHVSSDQIKEIEDTLARLDETRRAVVEGAKATDAAKAYSAWINSVIISEILSVRGLHAEGAEAQILVLPAVEGVKEYLGQYRATFVRVAGLNKSLTEEEVSDLRGARAQVAAAMKSPLLVVDPSGPKLVEGVVSHPAWLAIEQTYTEVIKSGTKEKVTVDSALVFSKITEVMNALRGELDEKVSGLVSEIHQREAAAYRNFWMVMLSLISVLGAVGAYTYWTVGDLMGRLQKVAQDLGAGSEQVANATLDISSASTELSASSTEQAAALQETVASIDEVSAMVSKNADNAKRSQEVASGANDGAHRGQQAILEMIAAIDDIARSNAEISRQVEQSNDQLGEVVNVISEIGNKTKVINDIVFQTKLLSFNASVEAARAGEHGKGFAVVAEEVGNLAQMSGAAAKEIGLMLDSSVQKVQNLVSETKTKVERLVQVGKDKVQTGTAVAKRCGEALENIVGGVTEVNVMVSEISTASQEQAQGVTEIGKAMAQMDEVTQQNSTAAQNMASAAEQLSQQAAALRSMVGALLGVVQGQTEKYSPAQGASNMGAKVVDLHIPKSQPITTPAPIKKAVGGPESLPSADDPRFEEV